MIVKKITVGSFKVNCYILSLDNNTNIVIDPGAEFNIIDRYLLNNDIIPDFILNTHGHYDHIGAVSDIFEKYKIPFYVHRLEEDIITNPQKNLSSFFGENGLSLKTYNLLSGNDIEKFERLGLKIIHTPGHTPGSIIIKCGSFLFTGDLLFKGGIGRTDLPGGDIEKIKSSLTLLKNLDRNLKVFPGHGENSILEEEFKTNYYLKTLTST